MDTLNPSAIVNNISITKDNKKCIWCFFRLDYHRCWYVKEEIDSESEQASCYTNLSALSLIL